MHRLLLSLALLLPLTVVAFAADTPLAPGATLQAFSIDDQHGKPGQVDEQTRVLMFSRDMTANKLAKAAFGAKPAQYLPEAHAMYLIDVSGMPSFVTKTFAIPKMQKYVYRIFLDREATKTTALPSQKKLVTVVHLDHLKVTSIEYAASADALVRAVEAGGK
jgi:hypothetical protein